MKKWLAIAYAIVRMHHTFCMDVIALKEGAQEFFDVAPAIVEKREREVPAQPSNPTEPSQKKRKVSPEAKASEQEQKDVLPEITVESTDHTQQEQQRPAFKPVRSYQHRMSITPFLQCQLKSCNNRQFQAVEEFFFHLRNDPKHIIKIGRNLHCAICPDRRLLNPKNQHDASDHMRTHAGCHDCYLCNVRLANEASFKSHMARHDGITPYTCKFCKRKFAGRTEHKRHEANHQ